LQGKKAEAKQSYATALKMNPASKAFNEALKRVS
jgi:predicted negative regulator of RcsB-dependent stress response